MMDFSLFKRFGSLAIIFVLVGTLSAAPQRLKWRKNSIDIGISASLLENKPGMPPQADVLAALREAFDSWKSVTNVTFHSSVSSAQSANPAGPRGDGVSLITNAATYENQSLFPKGVEDAAARTRVFYDAKGSITEADIVLNPFLQFSIDGGIGTFDLQATLTHELGHLLGLDHSDVLGSTMGESNAKNGVFMLPGYSPRTLSLSDIAAIRSLYGAPPNDSDCCARILGKLTLPSGKPAANWLVWVEDPDTGRVDAAGRTGADGSFVIGGIEAGQVTVFTQPGTSAGKLGFESLGEYSLKPGSTQQLAARIDDRKSQLSVSLLGFRDQLASSAVALNSGYVYRIYVAGRGLDPETTTIAASSAFLNVVQRTISAENFGTDLTVLSFEVEVSKEAQPGDYTIFVTSSGEGRAVVGALTVEKYPNIASTRVSTF